MIRTHGLTHIALAVRDLDRAERFYEAAFGAKEYFRDETTVQLQGPGPHDVLALELDEKWAAKAGGILHFGFRLQSPEDIDAAVEAATKAGGKLLRRGSSRRAFRSPTSPTRRLRDRDLVRVTTTRPSWRGCRA